MLFNGFKPLFQALSPDDINKLSYEIVQVFQGEGGTLEGLLAHTASVTQTLAGRDQVIGELIDNLNEVLDHVGDRDDQLSRADHDLPHLRRRAQGRPARRSSARSTRSPSSPSRPPTWSTASASRSSSDIKQLRRLAGNLDNNKAELDRALQVLPIKLNKVGRTAIYGSWFNFYLCHFKGQVRCPADASHVPVDYSTGADRCDLG